MSVMIFIFLVCSNLYLTETPRDYPIQLQIMKVELSTLLKSTLPNLILC